MIVLDASAAILGLLADGDARRLMVREAVVCPHLADIEVLHTIRRLRRQGAMDDDQAEGVLRAWTHLGIERIGVVGLVPRIWALRDYLSAYDATSVALAEALDVSLVTADARIARAPGVRCPVVIVPG